MPLDITSKSVAGIADLVVSAPIKQGFIDAFENITYESRLRLTTDAFYQLRVAAREYELTTPFTDVAERIQSLLDFRIGILDSTPQRRLILAATFDRAWEPYIRLIWNPLGTFLDVLFCNCEGYVTATDHSFPEYAKWVRANQVDSTIFYNTTSLSVGDQLCMEKLERLQRSGTAAGDDSTLARMIADDPEALAQGVRNGATTSAGNPRAQQDFLTMATEALVVLYRLADLYPPDHLQGDGKFLIRAAKDLFLHWNTKCHDELPCDVKGAHADAFAWLESEIPGPPEPMKDPPFYRRQVQAGVISSLDRKDKLIKHGCLMLLGVTNAKAARAFIGNHLADVSWEGDSGPRNDFNTFVNVAITKHGLDNIGVPGSVVAGFPKEFREGIDARAGLIGDVHANHPRRWPLPERFQYNSDSALSEPESEGEPLIRPPVELSEIDIILQLRTAEGDWAYCELPNDEAGLEEAANGNSHPVARTALAILESAQSAGVRLLSLEPMRRLSDGASDGQRTRDHFGFLDFISQPVLRGYGGIKRDHVKRGELVLGYQNDRGDPPFLKDPSAPDDSLNFLRDGTFLVIRKLRQNRKALDDFLADPPGANPALNGDDLLAKMAGRYRNGTPLANPGSPTDNDFDFSGDPTGDLCPFQAHIRRANPRLSRVNTQTPMPFGRPTPRIMRRGMSYGPDYTPETADESRGAMFMAYNASLAEQYEVIQRWINGGNSTGVVAAQNDPLVGVPPLLGPNTFRFPYAAGAARIASQVARVDIPLAQDAEGGATAFVGVEWGIYAFVPSRRALTKIARSHPDLPAIGDATQGEAIIQSLLSLPEDQARLAWKTYLEDFSTKDPAERCDTPDVWAAIRDCHGGAMRTPEGVLVASKCLVDRVFLDPQLRYSVGGQAERMQRSFGEIYVGLDPGQRYDREATATNDIVMKVTEEEGFDVGRLAAEVVVAGIYATAGKLSADHPGATYPAEIDLRADFITPCLALICNVWFGLPDLFPLIVPPVPSPVSPGYVRAGGWNWASAAGRLPQCPGDFMAPSRYCFYPDPTDAITAYGIIQGSSIQAAAAAYFGALRPHPPGPPKAATGMLTAAMCGKITDNDLLARNVIGIMVGALPPLDANLRGVLYEWIKEKTLWRYQQAMLAQRTAWGRATLGPWAAEHLKSPMMAAMRKRPAPDLLWRTALQADRLGDVMVQPGEKVILSVVSATLEQQNALNRDQSGLNQSDPTVQDDVFEIFGGDRWAKPHPVHACPASRMAMGTMLGILTALFEAGRIEALPGALLVKLTAPEPLPSGGYAPLVVARLEALAKKAKSIAARFAPAS